MRPDSGAARLGSPEREHDPPRVDPPPRQQAKAADRHDVLQPRRSRNQRRRHGEGYGRGSRRHGPRPVQRRELGSPRHQRQHPCSLLSQQAKRAALLEGESIPITKQQSRRFRRKIAALARRCDRVGGRLLRDVSSADTARDGSALETKGRKLRTPLAWSGVTTSDAIQCTDAAPSASRMPASASTGRRARSSSTSPPRRAGPSAPRIENPSTRTSGSRFPEGRPSLYGGMAGALPGAR